MLVIIVMYIYRSRGISCHHRGLFVSVVVSNGGGSVRVGLVLLHLHEAADGHHNEDDDEETEHNDDPDDDLLLVLVVVNLSSAVHHLLSVVDTDLHGGGGGVNGVLHVDEVSGVNLVLLLLSGELNLLVSSEVLVESLEGSEGVEHGGAVHARSLSGQRVVREVAVEVGIVSGGESTRSILGVGLRSSSVGKNAGSAVSSGVELSSLLVDVLDFSVVRINQVSGTWSCNVGDGVTDGTGSRFADLDEVLEALVGHLHVDQVHHVHLEGSLVGHALHPDVNVSEGEVDGGASEGKIFVGALAVVDLEHSVGVVVATDGLDESSEGGVSGASVDHDLGVLGGHQGLGSVKERGDVGVVDDGITRLVVVVSVVGLGFEGQVVDQLGVPSEDHFLQGAGGDETTESEVLDHPVKSAYEVVKLCLGVKSEGLDGLVHEGVLHVAHIFDGVVVVDHLGVVGVVQAEVRVLVTSQISDFNGAEGRRSLGTGIRFVEELTVVEVFGSLLTDSGNSPVGDGKAGFGAIGLVESREVVVVISFDVGRGEGDLRGSPLSSSDVLGRAILLVLGLHGTGAGVLIVVECLRLLEGVSKRCVYSTVVECSQHSVIHASSGLNSGGIVVPGSGSKELDIGDVVEVVLSAHGGDSGGGN